MRRASCLCGAVRIEVEGELKPPDACHCTNCRKISGHYWVSTDVPRAAVTVHGAEHVRWFQSSEKVRRGFCSMCGAPLFFDPPSHHDWIGVSMGAFDDPTGTSVHVHIFVSQKGDYYDLTDGLPQNQR
jgi:hypothetical protein